MLNPDQLLALGFFLIGSVCLTILNIWYANIFKKAAEKTPVTATTQTSITFVSGHLLAYFVLPFAIVTAASLAILGKLDSGVSAIIGVIITYIVQKVTIR
jgi:hypothetical protein